MNPSDPNELHLMLRYELYKKDPSLDLILSYIRSGADVNTRVFAKSAIHLAVQRNEIECTKALINAGANLDIRDSSGHSPLYLAAAYGYHEITELLITAGANLNLHDCDGHSPLHRAAYNGRIETTQLLINAKAALDIQDDLGWTALHIAAVYNQKEIFELLLNAGAPKDRLDIRGRKAWDLALYELKLHFLPGYAPLDEFTPYELGNLLLESLARSTPPDPDFLQSLLDAGAPLDLTHNFEETPLHLAARYHSPEIIHLLLKAGADPNARNSYQHIPLHIAAAYKNTPAILALSPHCYINAIDEQRQTALHLAVRCRSYETVKILLDAGADINLRDREHITPYEQALVLNQPEITNLMLKYQSPILSSIVQDLAQHLMFAPDHYFHDPRQ